MLSGVIVVLVNVVAALLAMVFLVNYISSSPFLQGVKSGISCSPMTRLILWEACDVGN